MMSSGCVINRGSLNGPADENDAAIPPLPDANLDAYSLFDVPPDAVVLPDVRLDVGMVTPPDSPIDAAVTLPPDAWNPPVCMAGALRCNDANTLGRCDDNAWVAASACALGCATTPAPHCRVMIPSTVAASEMNGTADVDLAGTMPTATIRTIDTSACTGNLAGGPLRVVGDHCVYAVRSLRVRPGAVLAALGTRPLIVLATGDITVDAGGSVFASAYTLQRREGEPAAPIAGRFFFAGPGASMLGAGGNGVAVDPRDSGGGGGGFCTNGGAGGNGVQSSVTATGGTGGSVSVPSDIASRTLRGGAPGGNGNTGRGGGGGGAVQLSARGRLTVSGFVVATGGAGEGGPAGRSGGGGGSGGMILVEGTELVLNPGSLVVRGGGGGGAGCSQTGASAEGTHGENGISGTAGGTGGECSSENEGGDGGSASSATAAAAGAGAPNVNGGGGGGGAGCVSIRRIDASTFDTAIVPNIPGVTALGPLLAE